MAERRQLVGRLCGTAGLGLLAGLMGSLVSACGDGAPASDIVRPAPGEMTIISETLIERPDTNLFAEGTMTWWAGAPHPSGRYFAPGAASRIRPAEGDETDTALRQTWAEPDSRWNPDGRFGWRVVELGQFASYTLRLRARTNSPQPPEVRAFGVRPGNELVQLAVPLLIVDGGTQWQEYTADFETGTLSRVQFTTVLDEFARMPDAPWLEIEAIAVRPQGVVGPPQEVPFAPGNRMPNGSFEVWPNGLPAPFGPIFAPAEQFSTLEPEMRTTADGNIAVHQVWTANDHAMPPRQLFGILVDVTPDTEYEFSCKAGSAGGGVAEVVVYGLDGSNAKPLQAPLLTTRPVPGYRTYTARFNSAGFDRIRFATRTPQGVTDFTNRVLWDQWELRPLAASDAAPATETNDATQP